MFDWKCYLFFLLLVADFTTLSHGSSTSEQKWKDKMKKLKIYADENNIVEKPHLEHSSVGTTFFNLTFECDFAKPSNETPTSVHRLRPGDINVVAAMGDSITAANGAEADTVVGIAREYRGISWSMGGEGTIEDTLTLPNILRSFNPGLKGYSIGKRFDEEKEWWFNVAVPGAIAIDMVPQALTLIEAMKSDVQVDFENDWKVVTIFIGGNDLCDLDSDLESQPYKYIQALQEALDILHAQLNRTLVNLVDILEIYLLPEIGNGAGSTDACRFMQSLFCNYIVNANGTDVKLIQAKNELYQNLTSRLISSGRYDTRDDFTVVIQPFLKDTVLPYTEDGQVDSSYFAPDCFHFSEKGHALGAVNLWNNMLEPVGQKRTQWGISDLKCPNESSPYIFTNLNSGLEVSGDQTTTQSVITSMYTTTPTHDAMTSQAVTSRHSEKETTSSP